MTVLGIDPGAASGWAIVNASDELLGCGTVTTAAERAAVVESALAIDQRLVVYAEKWTAGGWRSAASMMGLGAAWGAWAQALAEEGVPKSRVRRVYSQTWRAAILGGKQRSTEAWKEAACIALYGVRAERLKRRKR